MQEATDHRAKATKTTAPPPPGRTFMELCSITLLVLVAVIAYANSLDNSFHFDDSRITDNPHIQISDLSLNTILNAALKSEPKTRPVANITFAVNYYFHEFDVRGYHLFNILIHTLTSILFYFLARLTMEQGPVRRQFGPPGLVPLAAALIWVASPAQTQAVTYIVQRMTSMATMFYLLSLVCYARFRLKTSWSTAKVFMLVGCILSALLALGCKENVAVLPFFILLYELFFFRDLKLPRGTAFIAFYCAILVIGGLSVFTYLGDSPWNTILAGYASRSFTLFERVLTEPRVVLFYITLLFFPHPSRLNLDHDFIISRSFMEPAMVMPALLTILFLAVAAYRVARNHRLAAFAILWFIGNLIIESSFVSLELAFEHRLYLPGMMIILYATVVGRSITSPPWLRYGLVCCIVATFTFWTWERNMDWKNNITLWSDCAAKSPQKMRPHNNLGIAYDRNGNSTAAESNFRKALELNPKAILTHGNLGFLLAKQGQSQEAITHLEEAIRLDPNQPKVLLALGQVKLKQGNILDATKHFTTLLNTFPTFENVFLAHYNMGIIYEDSGNLEKAERSYLMAIKANPAHTPTHNNLGILLARRGRLDEAIRSFRRALAIDPLDIQAQSNLANALQLQETDNQAGRNH